MKLPTLLLAGSLAVNAALLAWLVAHRPTIGSADSPAPRSTAAASSSPSDADLSTVTDPRTLRERLLSLGLSKDVVEALVRDRIYFRYEARRRELLDPAVKSAPWWRVANSRFDPLSLLAPAQRKELRDLESAARDEMLALLGPASLDPDGLIAFRHGFVSPEKAVLLDALERDYKNLDAQLREETRSIRAAADREHAKLLVTERERDLAALLTPAEREALDLRASPAAGKIMGQMAAFQPTEAEYRAIFAVQKALDEKYAAAPAAGGPNMFSSRLESNPEAQQQLRAALGEQRYADWQFTGYRFVQDLATSASALGISGATVREVGTIVFNTTEASEKIWSDPAMTPTEEIDAMARLVADNRAQIAAKLGPEGAASYLKTVGWFDSIAQGRAVRLNGTSGFAIRVPPGTPPPPPNSSSGGMMFLGPSTPTAPRPGAP